MTSSNPTPWPARLGPLADRARRALQPLPRPRGLDPGAHAPPLRAMARVDPESAGDRYTAPAALGVVPCR